MSITKASKTNLQICTGNEYYLSIPLEPESQSRSNIVIMRNDWGEFINKKEKYNMLIKDDMNPNIDPWKKPWKNKPKSLLAKLITSKLSHL